MNTGIESQRKFFAELISAHAGVPLDSELTAAFASTPREDFVTREPCRVFTRSGYIEAPPDPAFVYQDITIALTREGTLNNGQPSLHAFCIAALDLKKGEHVVQVGTGTGYYTAILAKLVGSEGTVTGFEIDPCLAELARKNLGGFPNVVIRAESGTDKALPQCDVVYVNAGATSPLDTWLDALRTGGRLLFPLTGENGSGAMLLVRRIPATGYSARFLVPVMFVDCEGARDSTEAKDLSKAFQRQALQQVQSLHRGDHPDDTAWYAGEGWWLSTRAGA